MNSFDSLVNQNLGWVHQNKYVLPVLSLFLGMYAALARPNLPKFVEKLFENPVFRLVVISYIIYRGNQDAQLSIMIAAAFLITIHMINKQKVEKMSSVPEPCGPPICGSANQGGSSRRYESFSVGVEPSPCTSACGGANQGGSSTSGSTRRYESFSAPDSPQPCSGCGGANQGGSPTGGSIGRR